MPDCGCCLNPGAEGSHHPACLRALFGMQSVPENPYKTADLPQAVSKEGARMSISGVQIKASCRIMPRAGRLEIVGKEGTHILKPEPLEYPGLAECENLCMGYAAELGLRVPPHGLFRMADGRPCYLVKRFDRLKDGSKLHMEDMAQALGISTDDKYAGSLEQVGKVLMQNTPNPGLEIVEFFDRILLCFLIGNDDMHLKNWALLHISDEQLTLSPCYDLVPSVIYIKTQEETALAINGKKNRLKRQDFDTLASRLGIADLARDKILKKHLTRSGWLMERIARSSLAEERKEAFRSTVQERISRIL